MRKCRSCGKEYPDTLAFCPQDFTALDAKPAAAPAKMSTTSSTEQTQATALVAPEEPSVSRPNGWLPIIAVLCIATGGVGLLMFSRRDSTAATAPPAPPLAASEAAQPLPQQLAMAQQPGLTPALPSSAVHKEQPRAQEPPQPLVAEQPVIPPCTLARDPEHGEPLKRATTLVDTKPSKPTDSSYVVQAAALAEQATAIDPQCSDAWSILALARYRASYDICGRGDYAAASDASAKALELATEDRVKASTLRTQGRIAASQLSWDAAEQHFLESQKYAPTHSDANNWLGALAVIKNPRPELIEAINKMLRPESLTENDLQGMSIEETAYLENAAMARNGRRLNLPMADWLFFCDDSPLAQHFKVDLDAARRPIVDGSVDDENVKLVTSVRAQLMKAKSTGNVSAANQ